ncbi:hypothetical protein P152DRAFT_68432 [Eremomyces bilateralis CBS 781.70]|uniref:W2 domain-containing protein n=1 Tax=Eremomyces bilateralis CBS 781.70 TaxID=1392243 RepID=A0A6G1G0F7_9PEZI|nr:uncharacterized protein P152DRAFT_68432 [Eremomyces bilateralis CBS 781.70]KAF1811299.1 hypothetical protein P152DRAFT_68432 [Eremomyces bilateralis CBS 781.70]
MATVNIRRDVTDPFYRYKMEKLQSKIEGKGNGIKTVIVNLSSVSNSLARPPSYVIKYFGFELGAQTNTNPADDRWIINGAHEASKLQDYLDGFISRFVLCKKCKNPETDVHIKDGRIILDCKACGQRTDVDIRLKLSSFILKNETAKANGEDDGSPKGSPNDSNSDKEEENGDVEIDAGSDDELTRRIKAGALQIHESDTKEIKWSVDTSEEAVKARANQLPDDLKRTVVVNDEDDDGESGENVYDVLGSWIQEQAKEKGGVTELKDVDVYLKAKELGIETKHKTLTVLAQTIFDDGIVKEIEPRSSMLKTMIKDNERHQKAFLGGIERLVGRDRPNLIPQVSAILMKLYDNDVISEEVLQAFGNKASKKYVDISTSRKVRKSAEQFIQWLENAESDDDSEE